MKTDTARDPIDGWIGRTETRNDIGSWCATEGLRAIDPVIQSAEGAAPLLSHWAHFLDIVPMAEIGDDGHPKRGGFLPPVQLPRRMWAGSSLRFDRAIKVGAALTRRSTITNIAQKSGGSGKLCFVTVEHEVCDEAGLLLSERQDIVYRAAPGPGATQSRGAPAPTVAQWSVRVAPDPVLLFRYSALTANAHRIHYDRPYAEQVEGYAGLVVHGPLLATLLLHHLLARHRGKDIATFAFKAVRPVTDALPFNLCGATSTDGSLQLWVSDTDGGVCMTATARFR